MKKEVICIFLVVLLLVMPFSSAQLNSIEIKSVNVNENQLQVLVENNFNQNFNKITFIINNQYTIIQDETLKAFETKFFVVTYPGGIQLETIKVIIGDQSDDYVFIGNEDTFVVNQEVPQTSELAIVQESNLPVSYIYSNQRLAKIQNNNVIYYSSDNIGSTSLQTDNIGNINFRANYLPFGKELSFSSTNNERYGFTGKEYDAESSLNYFNARYYNPNNGKFISSDPIFKPTEGGYQYVNNNPLTITDPSGKEVVDISQIIEFSIHLENFASRNPIRYVPKQCIERCQKEEQDKIKKTNSEKRSFIYDTLIPSVGNKVNKIAKDVTLPIRVNPTVSGEEHVKRFEMISEALFFASLKLGKSTVDEFKKDIKGIGYVIGGVTGDSPAQRLGYIYYDERFFTEFRKTLNNERAFSIFLAYTLLSEDKSEERLDAKFLLALSPEEEAGLKDAEILWKTMYDSPKDKKFK